MSDSPSSPRPTGDFLLRSHLVGSDMALPTQPLDRERLGVVPVMGVGLTGAEAGIAEDRTYEDALANRLGDRKLRRYFSGILGLPRLDVGLVRSLRPTAAPVAVVRSSLGTNRGQRPGASPRAGALLVALRQRLMADLTAPRLCYSVCVSSRQRFRVESGNANFATSKVNSRCIIRTCGFCQRFSRTRLWTVAHTALGSKFGSPNRMLSSGAFVMRASRSATSGEQLRFLRNTLQRCD